MKKTLMKWLIKWFVIKMNLYLVWSKINQKLFQRKRKQLPKFTKAEVIEIMELSKWTKDKWWMLWDAISHPEYAFYNYSKTGSLGDCDDHAVFVAQYAKQWYGSVEILSMQWLDRDNKFHGHNVCLMYNPGEPFRYVITNGWAVQLRFSDLDDIFAYWVADGELLSWFAFEPDLSKINVHKVM